mgnify:CR=1 FL=1
MSGLLLDFTDVFNSHRKIFMTAAMLGILSGSIFIAPSQAARIVYDPKNTAEAVKILKESQNIVNSLGKQLGISEKQLQNINSTVNHYTALIETHTKNVEEIMSKHGGYIGSNTNGSDDDSKYSSADIFLGTMIPSMTDSNGRLSFDAKNVARAAAAGAIMSNNKDVLEAYNKISAELDKSEKELHELLKKNGELGINDGTLAAQQLNNQIKGLETHISGLHAQMDAIQGQAKVLQSQADAQDKENEYKAGEASAEATKKYIEENKQAYENSTPYKYKGPWATNVFK